MLWKCFKEQQKVESRTVFVAVAVFVAVFVAVAVAVAVVVAVSVVLICNVNNNPYDTRDGVTAFRFFWLKLRNFFFTKKGSCSCQFITLFSLELFTTKNMYKRSKNGC